MMTTNSKFDFAAFAASTAATATPAGIDLDLRKMFAQFLTDTPESVAGKVSYPLTLKTLAGNAGQALHLWEQKAVEVKAAPGGHVIHFTGRGVVRDFYVGVQRAPGQICPVTFVMKGGEVDSRRNDFIAAASLKYPVVVQGAVVEFHNNRFFLKRDPILDDDQFEFTNKHIRADLEKRAFEFGEADTEDYPRQRGRAFLWPYATKWLLAGLLHAIEEGHGPKLWLANQLPSAQSLDEAALDGWKAAEKWLKGEEGKVRAPRLAGKDYACQHEAYPEAAPDVEAAPKQARAGAPRKPSMRAGVAEF